MISNLAYIHPSARLEKKVTVEPFSTIYEDVEIGEGTWIGPNVTIMEGARIGKNCKIFPGAVISAIPQDLKYEGEKSITVIGDNTTIRECVTVNRGTKWSYKTVVGSNCLLMAYVHIAHDCIVGNNVVLANNVNLAGHIVIEDYVNIGGVVAVQQFLKIGTQSFITGGSLVRKDVPPFVKAAREPLSYAGVNSIGLKRRGYTEEQINNIHEIYKVIFVDHYNVTTALEEVEADFKPSPEKETIVKFIRESEKGIMKGYAVSQEDNA